MKQTTTWAFEFNLPQLLLLLLLDLIINLLPALAGEPWLEEVYFGWIGVAALLSLKLIKTVEVKEH